MIPTKELHQIQTENDVQRKDRKTKAKAEFNPHL